MRVNGSWRVIINQPDYNCYLRHLPSPFSEVFTNEAYTTIVAEARWTQPRGLLFKIAWYVDFGCLCNYKYGHVDIPPQQFPRWLSRLTEAVMPFFGITSKKSWPNSCNANCYVDGGESVN